MSSSDDVLNALNSMPGSPLEANTNTSLTGKYLSRDGVTDSSQQDMFTQKQVQVIYLNEGNTLPLCLGLIGTQKNSFCLKSKNSCKVITHSNSTFTPELDHYYMCKNTNSDSAWCEFKLKSDVANRMESQGIDFNSKKSHEDWKLIFSSPPYLNESEMDRAIEFMKEPQKNCYMMKTPAKERMRQEFGNNDPKQLKSETERIQATAALLHLTKGEKTDWLDASIPNDLVLYLENLGEATKSLFSDLGQLRLEMNKFSLLSDVSSDLTDLTSSVTGLKAILGKNSGSYPDVWTAIIELETGLLNSQNLNDINNSHHILSKAVTNLETTLKSYGNRWSVLGSKWIPLINKHETTLASVDPTISLNEETDRILNTGILPARPISHSITPSTNELLKKIEEMELRMSDMEEELEKKKTVSFQPDSSLTLPTRKDVFGYGSSGVSFKQHYFADELAVKTWMKANLSTPSHGLFVDLVSFTQFFGSDSYVERNVTLNELYMSNKIGYQTMADAYVATSFENVLPGAYGRNVRNNPTRPSSDVEMESQQELPGLPSFEKWDHTDGSTGRKYWITKECRKTGQQIDGMIRAQLEGEAQFLAKDLLTESIRMSEALFSFISTSYQDTFNSGRFDTAQAWKLTCKFVKRIFVELGDVRITARAGIHINEPWSSAAKFLFATLRAHEIMHSFMRLDIKNHPSISSEMVKFICYSQPASDTADVLNRIIATESMQRTHQSNLSKLELKAKKIDTWKADTDKLLKKLKEKTDTA